MPIRHPSFFSWLASPKCTSGGNLVSYATVMGVLDIKEEENLVEKAAEMGDYMKKRHEGNARA